MQRGDLHAEANYLDAVLKLDINHAQALFMRANLWHRIGNEQLAHFFWVRAFQQDSSMPVPWKMKLDTGKSLFEQGRLAEALAEFEAAHVLFEDWPEPQEFAERIRRILHAEELEREGDAAYASGSERTATKKWREASDYNADNADTLMKLGAIYADAGDPDGALSFFERAERLGHKHAGRAIIVCRAYSNYSPELGPEGV